MTELSLNRPCCFFSVYESDRNKPLSLFKNRIDAFQESFFFFPAKIAYGAKRNDLQRLNLKKPFFKLIYMMSLTALHVCVLCMCTISGPDAREGRKRVSATLELWVLVSRHACEWVLAELRSSARIHALSH